METFVICHVSGKSSKKSGAIVDKRAQSAAEERSLSKFSLKKRIHIIITTNEKDDMGTLGNNGMLISDGSFNPNSRESLRAHRQ